MPTRTTLAALLLAATILLSPAGLAHPTAAHAASPRWLPPLTTYALAYRGYPYAEIGDEPWTGFSCVGFVHYLFAHYGTWVPENVYGLYDQLRHIPTAEMRPGDILIFANTVWPGLSHAAIYLGGGYMIGADNPAWGVHVDYLWDSYWGPRFVTALRPWGW